MPNLPGFNGGKSRQLERLEFQRGRQISHLNLTAHPGKVQKDELPTSTLRNGFRRRSTTPEVLIALLGPYVEA